MVKRAFDIFFSVIALVVSSPMWVLVPIVIKLESDEPVFFLQERIGMGFKPFNIIKFRSMRESKSHSEPSLSYGKDYRITRVGRFLRRWKLDELPQFINVLRGDMSFVGPRPELAEYVEQYREDYEDILIVRPGITDLASIKYYNESEILEHAQDPEKEYIDHILPDKISLSRKYIQDISLINDLRIIFKTIFSLR